MEKLVELKALLILLKQTILVKLQLSNNSIAALDGQLQQDLIDSLEYYIQEKADVIIQRDDDGDGADGAPDGSRK